MFTNVNSNERIFAVYPCAGAVVNPILCNLADLETVVVSFAHPPIIKHFWNGTIKRISKFEIKNMLAAHGLPHSFLK